MGSTTASDGTCPASVAENSMPEEARPRAAQKNKRQSANRMRYRRRARPRRNLVCYRHASSNSAAHFACLRSQALILIIRIPRKACSLANTHVRTSPGPRTASRSCRLPFRVNLAASLDSRSTR